MRADEPLTPSPRPRPPAAAPPAGAVAAPPLAPAVAAPLAVLPGLRALLLPLAARATGAAATSTGLKASSSAAREDGLAWKCSVAATAVVRCKVRPEGGMSTVERLAAAVSDEASRDAVLVSSRPSACTLAVDANLSSDCAISVDQASVDSEARLTSSSGSPLSFQARNGKWSERTRCFVMSTSSSKTGACPQSSLVAMMIYFDGKASSSRARVSCVGQAPL